MRASLRVIVLLSWALWLGGIMGLFLSVQVLFHQTDRDIFLAAAPPLFLAFERYQLFLAAMALLSAFGWRILLPMPRLTALFCLFAIATVGVVVQATLITPRLEALRLQGATHTPRFAQIHGLSMCIYLAMAITLLAAGIIQAFCVASKSE